MLRGKMTHARADGDVQIEPHQAQSVVANVDILMQCFASDGQAQRACGDGAVLAHESNL